MASPLPLERKRPEGRPAPKLGCYRGLIDSWLRADREAPPKRRHTARRVFERLRDEHGVEVSERQVRRYVRRRLHELGEPGEAFVPQVHEPGAEAEVGWGRGAGAPQGAADQGLLSPEELERSFRERADDGTLTPVPKAR